MLKQRAQMMLVTDMNKGWDRSMDSWLWVSSKSHSELASWQTGERGNAKCHLSTRAHLPQMATGWQQLLRNDWTQLPSILAQLPSPRASLSLTDPLQFLVTIPEQGKGAERQLSVQLPDATRVSKGDAFSLVRQEA